MPADTGTAAPPIRCTDRSAGSMLNPTFCVKVYRSTCGAEPGLGGAPGLNAAADTTGSGPRTIRTALPLPTGPEAVSLETSRRLDPWAPTSLMPTVALAPWFHVTLPASVSG